MEACFKVRPAGFKVDSVQLEGQRAEGAGRQVALTLVSHRLVVRRTALRTAR